MSENRLLQIIFDNSHGQGAPALIVSKKYGPGYQDTLYSAVRRGHIEGSAKLFLTKHGISALREFA